MQRALGLETTKVVAGFKQHGVKEQGRDREAFQPSLGQIPFPGSLASCTKHSQCC